MKERIPLVYVLSNGRSGSTLLDLLLGTHPEVWTVGEAQILPFELRESRAPCGCGAPLEQCPFWGPLLPELPLDGRGVPLEHFRDTHGHGRVLRPELLAGLWFGRTPRRSLARANAYGDSNFRFFERVAGAASARRGNPVRWIVDASKDPYRLLWLKDSGRFDVRVVHLTKDPRAFVWSMIKSDERLTARRVRRFAARWLVENQLFGRLTTRGFAPEHVHRLRYEDLAVRPAEVLAGLGTWLGVEFPADAVHTFRDVENHAVSGNQMRWQMSDIRLDEAWRRSLPEELARKVWRFTSPVRRRLGYAHP